MNKAKILKLLDISIIVFLCLHVITSQWSIAASSIGLGGLIILSVIRIVLDKNIYLPERRISYLFLALIAAYIISSIFSIDPLNSFSNLRRIFLFAGFFATFMFIRTLNDMRIIITVLFLFTAFISILELVKYWIDFSSNPSSPFYEQRIQYYGYPITNAEIKMLILLLMASLLLSKEKFVLNRLWIIILAIPVLLSLYLTSSRNAFLGLFIGFVTLGLLKNKYFLITVVSLVILFLLFAPLSLKERTLSIVDFNHPSNKSRVIMWETGIKIIEDYPIIGIGDTDIGKVYIKYKPIEFHGEASHLHNNCLQILATTGILGFSAWLALMIYIFVRQIKIFKLTNKSLVLNTLTAASIAAMAAFQVSGLTEWNFGDFEFAAVLWFMLGLAFFAEKIFNLTKHSNAEA